MKYQVRNKCIAVIIMIAIIVSNVTITSKASDAQNQEAYFKDENSYIITSEESNKVIEVTNFGAYNGDGIQQWEYTRAESQQWYFIKEGSYYKIINKNSKKLLSVKEGNANNGDLVFQWDDINSDTQLWYIETCGAEAFQIKSKENNKCLDIVNISKDNGAKIQLWEDVDGKNQTWSFTELEEDKNIVSGGKYKIISKNSGKAIEVGYSSQENGGIVQQWDYEDGINQQWYLQNVEDKYFKIIADHSGKVLTVKNAQTNDGTIVEQRNYEGNDNQLWYFSLDSKGFYRIKSKHSNKCLEVKDIGKENGALLQIWQDGDGDNQKWKMELLSYQTDPVIEFSAYYDENEGKVITEWNGSETLENSELYVRYNKESNFSKYTTKTLEEGVQDTETEAEKIIYQEAIDVSSVEEDVEFRVVGNTKYGLELKSDIVTLKKTESGMDYIVLDSDEDGIPDGYEIFDLKSNPNKEDTDQDGFPDGYEVLVLCTSPIEYTEDADYDKDGLTNQEEMDLGTNPYLKDTDFDGILDSRDSNPLKQDVESNEQVDYSITIPTGYYDKKVCGYDEDGQPYKYIYNKLIGEYRYDSKGENYEIYCIYDFKGNQIGEIKYVDDNYKTNIYTYDSNGNVTDITHNGVAYHFTYNENNNLEQFKVGNQVLLSNSYSEDGKVQTGTTYGNGQNQSYLYDQAGENVTGIKMDGSLAYSTEYDENGNIALKKDHINQIIYTFSYDEEGNISAIKANDDFTIQYIQDETSAEIAYTIGDETKRQQTVKDVDSNSSTTTLYSGAKVRSYSENKRKILELYNHNNQKIINQTISTTEGKQIVLNRKDDVLCYNTDKSGNITEVYKDDVLQVSYVYDGYNQLIRENNKCSNKTYSYAYDNGGNITTVKIYPYTVNQIQENNCIEINQYGYQNSEWNDVLTSYNGTEITYDGSGNPLQYRDDFQFTWTNGRQLKTIVHGDDIIEYFYNEDGVRIKKVVNGNETKYHIDGHKIIGETTNGDTIWYLYNMDKSEESNDELNQEVIGFQLGNDTYYFNKNIYGDVIEIVDENGAVVTSYEYDAWGNTIKIDGNQTLGSKNPYRYRSYYFDKETGFAYLLYRYYDSNTRRFLNIDKQIGVSGTVKSDNLYCYCNNNPIKYTDTSGAVIETFVDIGSAVVSFFDLVTKPSWSNAGYLAWDIGSVLVPGAPGSYVGKGAKYVTKVASKASDFKTTKCLTLGTYNRLQPIFKGVKGVEKHHIFEKRLLPGINAHLKPGIKKKMSQGRMLSIPLEKKFHNEITQRWKKEIPYNKKLYKNLTKKDFIKAANKVYKDMPELRKVAIKWINEVMK